MKNYLKNLFNRTNKRLHKRLKERLHRHEYRADLFVYDLLKQFSNYLEENNIKQGDVAEKLGIDRSNVTQLFGKDSNIKVRTIFKYLDAVGLTIEHPKLTEYDIDTIYEEFQEESGYKDISGSSKKISMKEELSQKEKKADEENILAEDLSKEFAGSAIHKVFESDTYKASYESTG